MAKAWLRKEKTDVIEVMGATIELRNLSFGETRTIVGESTTQKGKAVFTDNTKVGILRVIKAIKSWDVTDENENVLPLELNTFDNILDEEFVAEVILKVNEFLDGKAVTEQEKK
ncbi:hypothetical protein FBHYGVHD_CDS0029 [Staphylococcus phage MVC_VPHSA1]|uniref:Tail assembly chaperone n=1 Tax=Staphylococcus phage MVC_VPHSA1 TaxID=3088876 RepID=A0ABZ0QZM1_9CAUD|nr:hypothetical protein FBHYGVHD_CDS0029 [Staphylococcus phage MVC_VPHSA1]